MLLVWWRYGRDPELRQITPCYEAPDIEVALASLLLNPELDDRAVYATLLELANAGYVAIEQGESGLIFRRLKPADDLPEYKQTLMQALFIDGDELNCGSMNRTRKVALRAAYKQVLAQVYAWSVQKGMMRTNPALISERFRKIGYGVVSACIVVALFDSLERFDGALFIPLLVGLLTWFFLMKVVQADQISWKIVNTVVGLGLIAGVLKMAAFASPADAVALFVHQPVWLQTLLLPMVFMLSRVMPAKTEAGAALSATFMGLKEFMQRADREQMQSRLQQDPKYMHTLMPYAVAFDVLPHWAGLMHQDTARQALDHAENQECMDFDDDFMDIDATMSGFESMAAADGDDDDEKSSSAGAGSGGGGDW